MRDLCACTVLRMGAGNAPEGFTGGRRRPWEKGRGLASVLSHWESSGLVRNVTLEEQLEGDEGSFAAVPAALHPGVRDALFARGVDKLYAHQARAFELAASGRDFVVATPTASGKSLCYNLPVLDAMAREPSARALYLFPTKALSRIRRRRCARPCARRGSPRARSRTTGTRPATRDARPARRAA